MKPCFVFDLDGTLANGDHRVHHIRDKEPKDWATYFSLCGDDEPIHHMIVILQAIASDLDVFIVSGRSDEVRSETMAWLREHTAMPFAVEDVYMRKAGDHRDDSVVKMEMLAEITARGYKVLVAFDDRDRVVAAWRKAGIPCLQVAPGDF
jgi:hypothetical protein